jgi:hypothetical protein
MPHFNLTFQIDSGPCINAHIGVNKTHLDALKAKGQPIPNTQLVRALVDTGAMTTVVDSEIIAALELQPTNDVPIYTPTTEGKAVRVNSYDIALYIPIHSQTHPFILPAMSVLERSLKVQGIDVLLGRDVLQHCLLVYDGRASTISMAF